MARRPRKAAPQGPIRFVENFNHILGERTVAYKAGMVVQEPSKELRLAAGAKAAPFTPDVD